MILRAGPNKILGQILEPPAHILPSGLWAPSGEWRFGNLPVVMGDGPRPEAKGVGVRRPYVAMRVLSIGSLRPPQQSMICLAPYIRYWRARDQSTKKPAPTVYEDASHLQQTLKTYDHFDLGSETLPCPFCYRQAPLAAKCPRARFPIACQACGAIIGDVRKPAECPVCRKQRVAVQVHHAPRRVTHYESLPLEAGSVVLAPLHAGWVIDWEASTVAYSVADIMAVADDPDVYHGGEDAQGDGCASVR